MCVCVYWLVYWSILGGPRGRDGSLNGRRTAPDFTVIVVVALVVVALVVVVVVVVVMMMMMMMAS